MFSRSREASPQVVSASKPIAHDNMFSRDIPDNYVEHTEEPLMGSLNDTETTHTPPHIPQFKNATNFGTIPEEISHPFDGQTEQPKVHQRAAPDTRFVGPPDLEVARLALADVKRILKPPRTSGKGYKDPQLHTVLRERLEGMQRLLWAYVDPQSPTHGKWIAASVHVAKLLEKKPHYAQVVRQRARDFIDDPTDLPYDDHGTANESILDKDEGIAQDIHVHLQGIGPLVRAKDLVEFMDTPEMRKRTGFTKSINIVTAQRWMKKLDYRWTVDAKGQFVDGHERADTVAYRQHVFLPRWHKVVSRTRDWSKQYENDQPLPQGDERHIVVWFHDESTFYANDRRKGGWRRLGASITPYAKGEGASQMVVDMVSPEYGWLRSPDGTEAARILFKAGVNREGYFTNADIITQVKRSMDILEKHYPHEDHVFIFDNATTHTKRADNALSARHMPKGTSKPGANWGVETPVRDSHGKPLYHSNRKIMKMKVHMKDGQLPDGSQQSLYFQSGESKGLFKGMAVILEERGLTEEAKLRSQCPNFKCPAGATQCCCRRVLYNQPDFRAERSLLEIECDKRGFQVIFLPKFHCKLNFIEQCWGYAKRIYRHYPASSKEADLERNLIASLESIPLVSMRR